MLRLVVKANVAVGASALLLFVVAWLFWQPRSEQTSRPVAAVEPAEPVAPSADMPAQAEPVPAKPPPVPAQAPAAPLQPSSVPTAANAEPTVPAHADIPVVPPPTEPAGDVELLERAYAQDRVDGEARAAESEIHALSDNEYVPPGTIQRVRCTERVCKVELRWTKAAPLSYMAVSMLLHQMNGGGATAMRPVGKAGSDDAVDVVLYVTRAGRTVEKE